MLVYTFHGDDVQVLGTGVISAVHDGAHRQSQGDAELVSSCCSSTLTSRHFLNQNKQQKQKGVGKGGVEGRGKTNGTT